MDCCGGSANLLRRFEEKDGQFEEKDE